MGMTDYTEEKFLKHAAGIATWAAPGTLYLALHTADPGDVGTSSEASGGSYARQAVTWTWNSGAGRVDSNAAVTFSNMPSGTFSHFSLKDAAGGGNTLFTGAFTSPQTLSAGQSLIVQSGDLRVTAD